MKHSRFLLSERGFTLIELVMVIVMLGVLAVFAAPRLFNSSDFYARGFHDEAISLLRYGQKAAIAQRRTVCVTFDNTPGNVSVRLSMASVAATLNCAVSSDTALPGPSGAGAAVVQARTGVVFDGNPSNFNFDGLGRPIASNGGTPMVTQTLHVSGASPSIVIEAATGYVHE